MLIRKLFQDRIDAGRGLARELEGRSLGDVVVVALPRGGVPVAYEVAKAVGAPLDVCVVRKLAAPGQPELGMGAIAEGGARYLNAELIRRLDVSNAELRRALAREEGEVTKRVTRFRGKMPRASLAGKVALLVDDGIATGGTARAAIRSVRALGARRIVLAVPVGAADTLDALAVEVDEIICPYRENALFAVGLWYESFDATSDDEVAELLSRRRAELEAASSAARTASIRVPVVERREVYIPLPETRETLSGTLSIPRGATGLVLFAHGSGSTRHSTRNVFVAHELEAMGLATLLFDLLTLDEVRLDLEAGRFRFDIELLARRLVVATDYVGTQPEAAALKVGYFGASTGAAAALVAAATRPDRVHAVVSRGGRPDLARTALPRVHAPTLLIVGSNDEDVLALNELAADRLSCVHELALIDGATHLFEEDGALEKVARLAGAWFLSHLAVGGSHVDRAAAG